MIKHNIQRDEWVRRFGAVFKHEVDADDDIIGGELESWPEHDERSAFIATLPQVLDFALIGSASYLPDAADVDFAVLVDPALNAVEYTDKMVADGWGNCGEYDGVGGIWAAVRSENLNLMVTHDPKFFADYKTAMEVCKALNLTHKQDRIAVCQIVRDGKKADEVMTHAKLCGGPRPAAAPDVLAAA